MIDLISSTQLRTVKLTYTYSILRRGWSGSTRTLKAILSIPPRVRCPKLTAAYTVYLDTATGARQTRNETLTIVDVRTSSESPDHVGDHVIFAHYPVPAYPFVINRAIA